MIPTRFNINDIAETVIAVGEAHRVADTVNLLFEAHGLNVYEVEAVLSRVSPEHLSKLQAMALGVVVGIHLAESGPATGEGPRG